MIDKPLYQNPLGGGLGNMIERPGGGNVPRGDFNNNSLANSIGNGFYEYNKNLIDGGGYFNVTPPSTPVSEQTPLPGIIDDPFKPKSDDPLMQGYYDSDFYSNIMTTDVVPYTFQGKEMRGSSSGASNLKKYLESIGKGDLLQFKNNDVMSVELAKVSGSEDSLTQPDNNAMIPGDPSAFTAPEFNDTGIFNSPSETTGQYLTGPNEDGNVLETLKNIEQGIASLGVNYGQGNNMNQSSNYGDFSNFGIGSFFPPYGGLYG